LLELLMLFNDLSCCEKLKYGEELQPQSKKMKQPVS
jgi:hypothetical protein